MVLLGVVIRKCETPTTNISQENGHGILMINLQLQINNSGLVLAFFLNLFIEP